MPHCLRTRSTLVSIGIAVTALALSAHARTYPSKPSHQIVRAPAGSGVDLRPSTLCVRLIGTQFGMDVNDIPAYATDTCPCGCTMRRS